MIVFVENEKILLLGDVLYIRDLKNTALDELKAKIKSYNANIIVESHENKVFNRKEYDDRLEECRKYIVE